MPQAGSWIGRPAGETYALRSATLPRSLAEPGTDRFPPAGADCMSADVTIDRGRIAAIDPPGSSVAPESVEARDGLLLPGFVDAHVHLDKGNILARTGCPEGDLFAAIDVARADRIRWTPEDLTLRIDHSLRAAHAYGTRALRTHIDWREADVPAGWRVIQGMRARWAGRVELQPVSLTPLDLYAEGDTGERIARAVAADAGVLGAFAYRNSDIDAKLARVFGLAARYDLELDFHVDEGLDPDATGVRSIAAATVAFRRCGRVTCSHACSLSVQAPDVAAATLARVREAGITLISLPATNLFLQDRSAARTPLRRGLTLIHEARALGIRTVFASDNHRDPFFPYGDLDVWQLFGETVRLAHLGSPLRDWIGAVTVEPARLLGLDWDGRLRPGAPADLVLLNARNAAEAIGRTQSDRVVIRAGRFVDTTLPDVREFPRA